jgi:hypothetical protein
VSLAQNIAKQAVGLPSPLWGETLTDEDRVARGLRGAGRIVDLRRQQHRAASSKRDINVSSASSSRAQKAIGPGHWQKSSLKVIAERHALNRLDVL